MPPKNTTKPNDRKVTVSLSPDLDKAVDRHLVRIKKVRPEYCLSDYIRDAIRERLASNP